MVDLAVLCCDSPEVWFLFIVLFIVSWRERLAGVPALHLADFRIIIRGVVVGGLEISIPPTSTAGEILNSGIVGMSWGTPVH